MELSFTGPVDLPTPTPEEMELSRQLAELAELEEALGEKERALARLEAELRVFEVHYLAAVGKRYAELDAFEAEIAEIEAQREPSNLDLLARAEEARARAQESADAFEGRALAEQRPGPPSESLKQLFRRVARLIHPDLAEDEATRARRQELMTAANRAYETGDETQLASLLRQWEESPESVTGHNPAAELLRAVRQIARMRERIDAIDQEIAALEESDLYLLRLQVEAAEAGGRDLLAEMAAAVQPQVEQASATLAALLCQERRP
jgi:hypothetical protein